MTTSDWRLASEHKATRKDKHKPVTICCEITGNTTRTALHRQALNLNTGMFQAKQHTLVWRKGRHLLSPALRPEFLWLNKVCAAEMHGVGGQLDRGVLGYSVSPNYHVFICDPEVKSYMISHSL